mgnify:CR=1 FL=1
MLRGLKQRPDLNGASVTMLRDDGYWLAVRVVRSGEMIRVKHTNVVSRGAKLVAKIPHTDVVEPTVAKLSKEIGTIKKLELYNALCKPIDRDGTTVVYKRVSIHDMEKLQNATVITPMAFNLKEEVRARIDAKKVEAGVDVCTLVCDMASGLTAGTCCFEVIKEGSMPTTSMFKDIPGLEGASINCLPRWTDNHALALDMAVDV